MSRAAPTLRSIARLLTLALLLAVLVPVPLRAHELQPGFLELVETAPGLYDVLWKLPSLGEGGDVRMPMVPVFPESCRQLGEARSERAGTAWIFTAKVECKTGLAGQTIAVEGLESFSTDVLVRVQHANGGVETHVLKPVEPTVTLRNPGDTRRGVGAYLYLGVEHILIGVDHLLFVLGLVLLVRGSQGAGVDRHRVHVAHSITLAVATFAVAGVLVAVNAKLRDAGIALLAVVAGLLHGLVNGATMAPGGATPLTLAGAITAIFCVTAILSAEVTALPAGWPRVVVRVAGSWIAAAGLLMLGWLLRPGG